MMRRCFFLVFCIAAVVAVSAAAFVSSTFSFCVNDIRHDASPPRFFAASLPSSVHSSSSLPDLSYGLSDTEFHSWLQRQVQTVPEGRHNNTSYSSTLEDSLIAIVNWRKRFRGNPQLWKRIFKKDRVIKELIESVPVIDFVKRAVVVADESSSFDNENDKFTIIDLCSGKGYLSMFLSEILPKERVNRFILVDKAWAIANKEQTKELKPHHMNWDHIYGVVKNNGDDDSEESTSSYFTTWPIPLYTSKQDLKDSSNQRQMKKHFFDKINGPIIILAVHLCGTLSLKAVELFNNNNQVKFFALKPCCLPQMVYANRGDVFRIGKHEFSAKDVCSSGQFKRKDWHGPPRSHLQPKFNCWSDNLFKGIDIGESLSNDESRNECRVLVSSCDGVKVKDDIKVQVAGGFQNTYIFAERKPVTPPAILGGG